MYKVYGRKSCQFCKRAMDLIGFNKQRAEFVELTKNSDVLSDMIHKGITSFPYVTYNDQVIGGYDDLVNHFKGEKNDS